VDPGLRSILIGTAGLDVAFIAGVIASQSWPLRAEQAAAVTRPALATLALQVLHFSEEFLTGFPQRFPPLLGLPEWSDTFFAAFNIAWIAVWMASITFLARAPRLAGAVLWFLALAAMANGIAHPFLALNAGGYFPGLLTAIPLGGAGIWLARRLMRAALIEA